MSHTAKAVTEDAEKVGVDVGKFKLAEAERCRSLDGHKKPEKTHIRHQPQLRGRAQAQPLSQCQDSLRSQQGQPQALLSLRQYVCIV